MKRLIFSVITFFILLITVPSYSQKLDISDLSFLSNYIEKATIDWQIPGLAIAIIQNDSIKYIKGFGKLSTTSADRVDENTIFAIASNTKSFTSAALAILVDEGKIDWDDRVVDYLPYFQLYSPYVSNQMTIRDLLSHRSGLKTFSGDLLWYGSTYSRKEIIKRAKYLKPVSGFRSEYGYSNIMYIAAGEVIAAVSGQSWDEFIESHFFCPLGMKNTNTSISKFGKNTNIAIPHIEKNDSLIQIDFINWDNTGGAAAINSSVSDMSKWIRLQLNRGTLDSNVYFSKSASWEMWSPQTIDRINEFELRFWPSVHFKAYGLGWNMFDYHGRKILEHSGLLDGMTSQVVLVPEEKLGFVVMTNSVNYFSAALMYQILDLYFDVKNPDWSSTFLMFKKYSNLRKSEKLFEIRRNRVQDTKTTLNIEDYTGVYGGKLYGDAKVTLENNKLQIKFLPSPIFTGILTHWQYDTFKIELQNSPMLPTGLVKFIIGKDNKIVEMKIDIPNPDFFFTELEFKKR